MLKIYKALTFTLVLLWICKNTIAQIPVPGKLGPKPILIANAEIHTATGAQIDNGYVLIVQDKIAGVGPMSQAPKGDYQIINAAGSKVYPGLILPNTPLGLTEVDAVRATRDFNETGELNPNARSIIAYNPESNIIPTVRSNGVLLAQCTPRGGTISGTSSIVQLDAWNWEDAVYKLDDGIHLNYPASYRRRGWWAEMEPAEKNNQRDKMLVELDAFFKEAKAYASNPAQFAYNPRYEAMKGLFNGTKQLFINSHYDKDIEEAIRWAKGLGISKIVIVTSSDLKLVADYLKETNTPVVLSRLHRLPSRAEDHVSAPFTTPKWLYDQGILFCLDYQGDMEAMGSRNLAFLAGTAVAYGLPYQAALQAITLNAAKILGIEQRTGSIEAGKDANIIIVKGDLLNVATSQVTHAFIQGRPIDLDNRQKQLMRKYTQKLGIQLAE